MTVETPFPEFRLTEELLRRSVDLMVLGNSRLEMVIRVPKGSMVGGQKDLPIDKPIYTAGGCGANVASFAARWGGRVLLVSRLGDGRDSEPVWEELRRSGVDRTYVKRIAGGADSLLVILTDSEGDWTVLSHIDPVLEVRPEDLPARETLARAKILHIDGYYWAQDHPDSESVVGKAREAGCLISMDGATPVAASQPTRLRELFSKSDIVFANEAEALAATATKSLEQAAGVFAGMGPRVCFLKKGKEGSLVVTPQSVGRVPPFETHVVDTVAAGDAYAAAALFRLSRGGTLREAAVHGSAAGALACRGAGSLSRFFGPEEIEALVKAS
jgi:ribokinase